MSMLLLLVVIINIVTLTYWLVGIVENIEKQLDEVEKAKKEIKNLKRRLKQIDIHI